MLALFQWTKPPAASHWTSEPAEKRPTPLFWIMRKARASVEARPTANTTAAASIAPAVLWVFMTSSIPAPGPAGRGERLAVTGELTDLRQHLVQREAFDPPRGIAQPIRIGDE